MTLGRGAMRESFHWVGNIPEDIEQLKMEATGSAISGANCFQIRVGFWWAAVLEMVTERVAY